MTTVETEIAELGRVKVLVVEAVVEVIMEIVVVVEWSLHQAHRALK